MQVFKYEIKKTLILGFNYDDMSFDHCLAFYSVVLADRVGTFRRMEVTFPNQLWGYNHHYSTKKHIFSKNQLLPSNIYILFSSTNSIIFCP